MRRLILFDIDGTLLRGGPAKEAFRTAMMEAYGTVGDIDVHEFSGKTDPQIARELLTGAGLSDAEVDEGMPRLWAGYREELEARLSDDPVSVLPGVGALMEALAVRAEVALGLVTGNIVAGAELKLRSAGLARHFRNGSSSFVGGFGSDHEERNHLPAIALRRARESWKVDFAPTAAVLVGDTPRDVACGRFEGIPTVAVATGNFGRAALEAAGADRVFEDFSETERVTEVLAG